MEAVYETSRNSLYYRGADGQSRCRERIRTRFTGNVVVLGYFRTEHDYYTARRIYERIQSLRDRYARRIHVYESGSQLPTARTLPIDRSPLFRRGCLSFPRRKPADGQYHSGERLPELYPYRSSGTLHQDVPNHGWKRTFQGCVRHNRSD